MTVIETRALELPDNTMLKLAALARGWSKGPEAYLEKMIRDELEAVLSQKIGGLDMIGPLAGEFPIRIYAPGGRYLDVKANACRDIGRRLVRGFVLDATMSNRGEIHFVRPRFGREWVTITMRTPGTGPAYHVVLEPPEARAFGHMLVAAGTVWDLVQKRRPPRGQKRPPPSGRKAWPIDPSLALAW